MLESSVTSAASAVGKVQPSRACSPGCAMAAVNILLVDDQQANLLALEAVLEPLGQNLITAHSGEEALRLLLDKDFAVVLLDVRLGSMDGFEVAQLIRARQRSR